MLPLRGHLPTRTVPFVNYALIAANVVVFGLEAGSVGDDGAVVRWALVPSLVVAHPIAYAPTLFSHMFLHAGLPHLAGNMLFLWIFGGNVEDALGHGRYAAFYLVCGLAAAFAQIAVGPHATIPMLGASGAISGVLAAYATLYPRAPITVLDPVPILWFFWGPFLSFPAWVVILEFFGINLWNALQSSDGSRGVAFVAHVGGFVAGLVLVRVLRRPERVEYDPWKRWVVA